MNEAGSNSWFQDAQRPEVVTRGLKVSAIVGSILVLINQGDVLFGGATSMELLWKIPLTYCVPFAVSTYAAVEAIRSTGARNCNAD